MKKLISFIFISAVFLSRLYAQNLDATGDITEGSENGDSIIVTLSNTGDTVTFKNTLNPANWALTGQPLGVSIGSLTREDSVTVTIILSGSNVQDYDSDITGTSVTVDSAEFNNLDLLELSSTGGVAFHGSGGVETLDVYWRNPPNTDGEEATIGNDVIRCDLSGGTLIQDSLTTNNLVLSGAGANFGISIGNILYVDLNTFDIEIDHDGTDFDNDYYLTVELNGNAYHDGNIVLSDSVLLDGNPEGAETISINWENPPNTNGEEATLNDEIVHVVISNGTFITGEINNTNVTLTGSGASQGITIESFQNITPTSFDILLAYDGTDFDSDLTLNVNVDGAAYNDGTNTMSDNLNVNADNDGESINLTWANPPNTNGEEATLNDEIVTVTLSGGTFITDSINTSHVTLSNSAATQGVTIENIQNITSTSFDIALDYSNGDFDSDVTLTVNVSGDAYNDGGSTLSRNITINANNDAESIVLSWANPPGTNGAEATLNGDIVTVTILGGTFITGNINTTNVILLGTAVTQGVSIDTIQNITSTSFDIALAYSNGDFDADVSLTVEVDGNAYEVGNSTLSNNIAITANNDAESINLTWTNPPGTNGAEATLDDDVLTVSISGGTFITGNINTSNVVLSGTAVTQGISIEAMQNITPSSFDIALDFEGPDFDTDLNLIVDVSASAYNEGASTLTNNITVTSLNDAESISLAWRNPPGTNGNEPTLDSEVLTVTFNGGTLDTSLVNATNVTLAGNASTSGGVSLESIQNKTATSFDILLAHDGTDFDIDRTLTVRVDGNAYDDGTGTVSNSITVSAFSEAAYINIISAPLTEGSENNDTIEVILFEDIFDPVQVNDTNVIVSNLPSGVSVGNVLYVDSNQVDIALSGNRNADFDLGITLTVRVLPAALQVYTDTVLATTSISAVDDPESISISGSVNESLENGDSITVTVAGGTFAPTLDIANWTVSNLPVGVSAGSVLRTNETTAQIILSGTRDIDFDTDLTNVSVSVTNTEIDDHNGGDLFDNTGVTIVALDDAESISGTLLNGGAESTLDNEEITITLNGGTLVQGNVNTSNVLLGNVSDTIGLSIESITNITANSFTVRLAWDSTDFDNNKNLQVTLNPAAYNEGFSQLNDTLTLIAGNDVESIGLTWGNPPNTGGAENTLDNEIVRVSLTGGSLIADSLTTDNIFLTGTAASLGVEIGAITYVNRNNFDIALDYSGPDFDADIPLTINVTGGAYNDGGATLSENITIAANNDAETISLSWGNPPNTNGAEASLDNEVVRVTITGGTLVQDSLIASNVTLSGDAVTYGVGMESVTYINDTVFDIALNHTGRDFDTDKTLIVSVSGNAYNDGPSILSNNINITALDDPESLNLSWRNPPGTGGAENTLNNEVLRATISGGSVIEDSLDVNHVTLSGDAVAQGVSISSIVYVDIRTFDILLAYAGPDFDTDRTLNVSIDRDAYDDRNTSLNSSIAITANNDVESISLNWANPPNTNGAEATLDNEVITVSINGGSLIPGSVNISNVSIGGDAVEAGISIETIQNITTSSFDIALNFNGPDFDTDKTLLVSLTGDAYDDGTDTLTNNITITANNDAESISLSWANPPGTNGAEATLTNEIVTVAINGGSLITDSVDLSNVYLTGDAVAAGVSIEAIQNITTSSFDLDLAFNGPDFDTDKTLTIHINGNAYDDGSTTLSDSITITALDDAETIALAWGNPPNTGGIETTLNDEIIIVTLSGGSLIADSVVISNVTLSGDAVDAGVSMGSVQFIDSVTFEVSIDFNGPDFDTDKTLSVNLGGNAYNDGTATISNNIVITANNDPESISLSWRNPPNTGGAEASLNDEVIRVNLSNGSLITDSIIAAHVTLSGDAVTAGITLESVQYIDGTTFDVAIDFNGPDFDTDKTLVIELDGNAYDDGDITLSNSINITANNDAESIGITWANPPNTNGAEETLDNEVITVAISGGNFTAANVNTSNVSLSGEAADLGVSIENILNVTSASFDIALDYNGPDFDSDLTLTVHVNGNAYDEGTDAISNNIIITANDDAENISLVWNNPPNTNGNEATLNDEIVRVHISGGDFIPDSLTTGHISLSGSAALQGVTIESIQNTSIDSFDIHLAYTGPDFDSDLTLTVNIGGNAYNDGTTTISNNIIITANNDAETISLAWKNPPGTNGHELTLYDEVLVVAIAGGDFDTNFVNTSNISLGGNAVPQAGLSIESIDNVTTSSFEISLNYDDTDFDFDKSLVVQVGPNAYHDGALPISQNITVTSFTEDAVISILPRTITEGSENGDTIKISMIEDIFAVAELNTNNIAVYNLPEGVGIGEILYIDTNRINIVLAGNRTVDFDSDRDFTVEILPVALQVYADTVYAVSTITAINDPESISLDGAIHESFENGDSILVRVSGGTFSTTPDIANWTVTNLPDGVDKDTLIRINDTTVAIVLTGTRVHDYDSDITNVTLTLPNAEIDEHTGANVSANTGVTFIALDDTETIQGTFLVNSGEEGGLDEEEILITLNGGTLVQNMVNLATVSLGDVKDTIKISIDSITDITANTFIIHLAWDSIDFDDDKDLILYLDAAAYNAGSTMLSDTLTITANNDIEIVTLSWAGNPGTNGLEPSLDDDVIKVQLTGGTFIPTQINTANVTLSGSAVESYGVSLESLENITLSGFLARIDWDATDFDTDQEIIVNITGSAYDFGSDTIFGSINTVAVNEEIMMLDTAFNVDNTINENKVKLGSTAFLLKLSGASWIPGDGADTTYYKSSTLEPFFNGFTHKDGINDLEDFLLALKNDTILGDNNAVRRVNDSILRIDIPETNEYDIEDGEERISIKVPASFLNGTNGDEDVIGGLVIKANAAIHATFLGGGPICNDGTGKAKMQVTLGGEEPWSITYHNAATGDTVTVDNIFTNVYTFFTSETGTYYIDIIKDKNFILKKGNINISNDSIEVYYYEKTNVYIDNAIKTVFASGDTSSYNMAPYGFPYGGEFKGKGVLQDTIFYAPLAGITQENNPHKIVYVFTDTNSCIFRDTALIQVLESNSKINIPDEALISCWYDTSFIVTVTNSQGIFGKISMSGKDSSAVIDYNNNTATVLIDKLKDKDTTYYIVYTYEQAGQDFVDSASFSIEYIQPVNINLAEGDSILCDNEDIIDLKINPIENGTTNLIEGSDGIFEELFAYNFDPKSGNIGENPVYFKTSKNNCYREVSTIINVLKSPVPDFNFSNNCIDRVNNNIPVEIINLTDTTAGNYSWKWTFGEGSLNGDENAFGPRPVYESPGVKLVVLVATSNNGKECSATRTKNITLNLNPEVDFTAGAGCFDAIDSTVFTNISRNVNSSSASEFTWYIKDQDTTKAQFLEDIITSKKDLKYKFPAAGNYNVSLVQTSQGCIDSAWQKVFLRPTIKVKELDEETYYDDFETIQYWSTGNDENNSWVFDNPEHDAIASTANKAWYTDIIDAGNDSSVVESPCFNLNDIERPMIKMDIWRSLDGDNQGAVLQYLEEGATNWLTVGDVEQGTNWFNRKNRLITASPGGSTTGWGGEFEFMEDSGWVSARHHLDFIENPGSIRFRVAFASKNPDGTVNSRGFAFDDFWLGPRGKKVLLEHFTNTQVSLSAFANDQVNQSNATDVIVLQYHTPFPEGDPFYSDSKLDLGARYLFYKNTSIPNSIMDGGPSGQNWTYDHLNHKWNTQDPESRALEDAKFKIDIVNSSIVSNKVIFEANISALENIGELKLSAYIVIYEEEISAINSGLPQSSYKNVVKKILPDPAGIFLVRDWKLNDSENIRQEWLLSGKINNPERLYAAIFIQDRNTSEVYQVENVNLEMNGPVNIENPDWNNGFEFSLYPNPSSGIVNLELINIKSGNVHVELRNSVGQLIYEQGYMKNGVYELNFQELKQGVYLLNLHGEGMNKCRKIILAY